ncbi:MAG: YkgJ family cysteine cluster protein [Desulfurococcaceae archaeon]|nr:YkgJ family cysteine cluster protein [Desulfurococcaceae archaeon]
MFENNDFCKKCAKCCFNTEMILTLSDITRLESKGYRGFYEKRSGFYRLININGRCVFLSPSNLCLIYEDRPLGCRAYPLIYDEARGVIVDSECPLRSEISCEDLYKGLHLLELVLREVELTYNYRINWGLFEKSAIKLISKCI